MYIPNHPNSIGALKSLRYLEVKLPRAQGPIPGPEAAIGEAQTC